MRTIFQMLFFALLPFCAFMVSPDPARAHEFWIEPERWQIPAGGEVRASIRIGTEFSGSQRIYFPSAITRFEVIGQSQTIPARGRLGDLPAGQFTPLEDGLHIIVHETTSSLVKYKVMDKFTDFTLEKGYPEAIEQHRGRGLPETGFVETYRRFAKSLIAVGHADGSDRNLGLEVEITALATPFTITAPVMPMILSRDDAPWAGVQVTVFSRPVEGEASPASIQQYASDDNGRVEISIIPGHTYLVDAVSLDAVEPGADPDGAVWASRWASTTFTIPEREE